MFNLVYSSTAFRALSHDDLFLLLAQSRKHNQLLGITGVLLYSRNRFMQLIEGEEKTVLKLFEKVKKDIRHKDINTELTGYVGQRRFPDWSMGFTDADEAEKYNIPGFSRFLEDEFDPGELITSRSTAFDLLLDFRHSAMHAYHLQAGVAGGNG